MSGEGFKVGKAQVAFRKMGAIAVASYLVLLIGISCEGSTSREKVRDRVRNRIKQRISQRAQERRTIDDVQHVIIEEESTSYRESPYGAGDYRRYVHFGGRKRFYDIHVPFTYNKNTAIPLVLNFHGGGGKPTQQRRDSGMDAVSDTGGFIVVYPAGTGEKQDRSLSWNSGIGDNYANKHKIDDVGFTRLLLKDIEKLFHIDQKKVYVTGFSNGGFMCYRLAVQLSNRFAAIAPVSGVMGTAYPKQPSRAISVLHFHGLKDAFVPYRGGSGRGTLKNAGLPSVEQTIDFWIDHNGCSKESLKETRQGKAVRRQYRPGKNNTEVILWTLEDGGHTWPGGKSSLPELLVGKINTDINASQLIWEFFKRHSL